MLTHHTLESLRRMKLTGMADAFEQQLQQPGATADLSFEERFGMLVDHEATYREDRRLGRLLRGARFKQPACAEDVNYRHPRGLDKRQMASLITCDWIRKKQNVCITGPTGCGKTWLACALGNQACREGLSVLYTRMPRLFEELRVAHGDGSFARRLAQLSRKELLIMDDWGLKSLSLQERHDLLEIMEDRHGSRSTVVTSQLPIERWHEYLNDPALADAILDRLLHNAYKLALKGESMRKVKNRHE